MPDDRVEVECPVCGVSLLVASDDVAKTRLWLANKCPRRPTGGG